MPAQKDPNTANKAAVATGSQGADFSLGDAGNYAVIAFAPTGALQLGANANVNGNVGVNGSGTDMNTFAATAAINGNLVLAGTSGTKNASKVSGTITTKDSQIATDASYLKGLSSSLGQETGTALALSGKQSVQATSGTADAAGNYVFNITSAATTYNLTVAGDGSHDVVFNIAPGVNFHIDKVTLSGGLAAHQVLFNYTGSNPVTSDSGATFEGTILAPNTSVTLKGNTVDGSVYANAVALTSAATLTDPVCFVAGTMILTRDGGIAVEALTQGDRVVTAGDGTMAERAVKWIGHRQIDLARHPSPARVAPVRIAAGSFADGMPERDLVVSPDHGIFADGKLICARQLINHATITQDFSRRPVDYYHIELTEHAIVLAEGLPAESYLDTGNRGFFANSGLPLPLYPMPARETASCVPFASQEPDVKPVWDRLARRAAALGKPVPAVRHTAEPELRLAAGGRMIAATRTGDGRHVFVVPRGGKEVQIVSRSAVPTDVRPWLEDRRRLGVYVERIVFRGGGHTIAVPLDHPELVRGWWEPERNGLELRRWTDGAATVAVPSMAGPIVLEVNASGSGLAYPLATGQGRRAA